MHVVLPSEALTAARAVHPRMPRGQPAQLDGRRDRFEQAGETVLRSGTRASTRVCWACVSKAVDTDASRQTAVFRTCSPAAAKLLVNRRFGCTLRSARPPRGRAVSRPLRAPLAPLPEKTVQRAVLYYGTRAQHEGTSKQARASRDAARRRCAGTCVSLNLAVQRLLIESVLEY